MIGLSLGDPTGIGPELLLKVLAEAAPGPPMRLYGDAGVLERAGRPLGLRLPPGVELREVTSLSAAESEPGRPCAASGAAQVAYLEAALLDARAGQLDGLCTAPIHKASAIAAGLPFPGHTELLAARLAADPAAQVVMMLCGPSLRVALATTHLALRQVPAALSVEGLVGVLRTTVLSLAGDFGVRSPLVLVAGLNPHAGEEGHFGDEERTIIGPAIERARALPELAAVPGLVLKGPEVPDAVFRAAVHPEGGQKADAVVAMYHDQGLIPLKLLDFDEGVNVTLGLSIVRTSPDHGVAHDIAGQGRARPGSLRAALSLCQGLVRQRQSGRT